MKCKVKMGDKISPADGSSNGETGTCPECETPGVVLSVVGGYIRAHTIADAEIPENNPKPATLVAAQGKKTSTGLSEPVVSLTDTGVRIGDPRAAEQRRVAEIEGACGIGTVKVPIKGENGRIKMTDVPATEENVREALEYWKKRKPRTASSRAAQNEMVSLLTRRAEGFRKAREDSSPGKRSHLSAASQDAAQVHRGPTLVRGRDTPPRLREPELPWSEGTDLRRDGTVRKVTTFEAPLGRERFDRKITDVPEPKPKRTPAERARYRREQRLRARMARQSSGKRA